jgi:predicted metal-binding protein
VSGARATIFVCVTCRVPIDGNESDFETPGGELAVAIENHLRDAGASEIEVRPVECLSVCKRPCTIAFAAGNKWTYLVGGIDARAQAGEVAAAAQQFAATDDGVIPWKERPLFLRKGVIGRIPPETYRMAGDAE